MNAINGNFFGEVKSGVIFAADMPTAEENYRVLDQIHENIDVIKLSSFLAYREGLSCIRNFKDRYKKPIFADFKVADVPHTNAKIVEIVRDAGGDAVMLHAITGPDSIADCVFAAQGKIGIILQIELTNPGGLLFTAPIAEDLAQLATNGSGVYGLQAPGNRPEKVAKIRSIVGKDPVIVCCGVGKQGGSYSKVKQAGGTYSILGRAVYEAEKPNDALLGLMNV